MEIDKVNIEIERRPHGGYVVGITINDGEIVEWEGYHAKSIPNIQAVCTQIEETLLNHHKLIYHKHHHEIPVSRNIPASLNQQEINQPLIIHIANEAELKAVAAKIGAKYEESEAPPYIEEWFPMCIEITGNDFKCFSPNQIEKGIPVQPASTFLALNDKPGEEKLSNQLEAKDIKRINDILYDLNKKSMLESKFNHEYHNAIIQNALDNILLELKCNQFSHPIKP